ncbi:MAG: methionine synthase [Propionibacteriaceae bacterium]|nr:methionine synthase [Propionibacteriaceae bacterium]
MSSPVPLRSVWGTRTLIADGAMGTALQDFPLSANDFSRYEGCNEILNITRPEVVAEIHRTYLDAGADLIETNTFGANLSALREYGVEDRLEELAEAGARIARKVADEVSTPKSPRWVLGSVGPGTKLPSLSQITYGELRDSYQRQVAAMIRGGIDAIQIETSQDLLCTRAAVAGARKAISQAGGDHPIFVSITIETTGTMLVGADISAVVATLVPLGIDALGLNCATGPEDMREALRQLADLSPVPLSCMPNAGMPDLTTPGGYYQLGAEDFARALNTYVHDFGLGLVGGCCGTTPDHIRALDQARPTWGTPPTQTDRSSAGIISSMYTATSLTQEISYLSIGERTNASGSKAFREALILGNWDGCVEVARGLAAEGAHVLDLCVDYVGRDGATDMAELASRLSRDVDLPLQIDSSRIETIGVGLENTPGRAIVNSVNLESGSGPNSKFAQTMELVREHGAAVVGLCIDERGQARSAGAKFEVASRLIELMVGDYSMDLRDIIIDPLTYPVATGQDENRRDALNTMEALSLIKSAYPEVLTGLGISNVSFGLKPAARVVLNSVFLNECRLRGLDTGIVPPARILPLAQIPDDHVEAALALLGDDWVRGDPVERFVTMFDQATATVTTTVGEDLPVSDRLRHHIIAGVSTDLEANLHLALDTKSAVDIINDDLLDAMKEVGENFGAGRMQLPFVLKSAEIMKKAVSFLEPHMDRTHDHHKGTLVLATVRGDVHDIGKNLVDIILSNNGYKVVNLGIKQPIADIITAAGDVNADAIGLSGLLVKSTQIMKENLVELNAQGLTYPVFLGGAALTRAYVEKDCASVYEGQVRYAHDAFEGLKLMEEVMGKTSDQGAPKPPAPTSVKKPPQPTLTRSRVTRPIPPNIPEIVPPFYGVRHGSATLDDIVGHLDHRTLFTAGWGLSLTGDTSPGQVSDREEAEARLAHWMTRLRNEDLIDGQVVWGHWGCHSQGNTLVIDDSMGESRVLSFPRQDDGEFLCLADYFRDGQETDQYGPDVVSLQLVTIGKKMSQKTQELFENNHYRDYYELHGLSVHLTEALAEYWHALIRAELGLGVDVGQRYSLGYPSCPDLAQRQILMEFLHPETIGVTLSEEYQLHPEQSTEAILVHHPQARYFSVRTPHD